MIEKTAETSVPINDLIARRWSGRALDAERPVAGGDIVALLEAARWAPSCYGDQPWRYIVCNKHTNMEAWQNAVACLSAGNQSWARFAPLLILVVADNFMTRDGRPNRWGQYDTGAASISICLQAVDLGLMTHQMGGFDTNLARKLFCIPAQCTPMSVLAVGYALPETAIAPEMKERELRPRMRSPLTEHFYDGAWNVPYISTREETI
ncbi:MAG: nitroreductase family protein [Gammaproteobacteria bacterium]